MYVCASCASTFCGRCEHDGCDCYAEDSKRHEEEYARRFEFGLPKRDAPDRWHEAPLAEFMSGWYVQPDLPLDTEAVAASKAMASVAANSAPWVAAATEALRRVALKYDRVTSDDVWHELRQAGVTGPHDTRAIGAVMKRGIEAGWLESKPLSGTTRPKVWKSAIKGAYNYAA